MCKETFPGGGEGGVKRNFRGRMCRDISGGGGGDVYRDISGGGCVKRHFRGGGGCVKRHFRGGGGKDV